MHSMHSMYSMYNVHVSGWISVGGSHAYTHVHISVTADSCPVYIITHVLSIS